jgi:hypothetical protein
LLLVTTEVGDTCLGDDREDEDDDEDEDEDEPFGFVAAGGADLADELVSPFGCSTSAVVAVSSLSSSDPFTFLTTAGVFATTGSVSSFSCMPSFSSTFVALAEDEADGASADEVASARELTTGCSSGSSSNDKSMKMTSFLSSDS